MANAHENIDELLNIFGGKKKLVLTDTKVNNEEEDTELEPPRDKEIEISKNF